MNQFLCQDLAFSSGLLVKGRDEALKNFYFNGIPDVAPMVHVDHYGGNAIARVEARNTMAPYLGEGLGGLSTEHALSLSVRDSAALVNATAGPGAGDPYTAPLQIRSFLEECGADPGSLRIAVTTATPNGVPLVVADRSPSSQRS